MYADPGDKCLPQRRVYLLPPSEKQWELQGCISAETRPYTINDAYDDQPNVFLPIIPKVLPR